MKKCINIFIKKKGKKELVKPDSMQDVPSSGASDCSDEEFGPDTFKGLSQASKYLGEGAILYL